MKINYTPQRETVIVEVLKSYEEVVHKILEDTYQEQMEQEQEDAELYVKFMREEP